ncbi:ABC transporter permease [Microbispora sp. CA-102843]|uniref:ABC transporter permease n=1 Tax=Microbispora sp. CA-102843 TaxID=3239952 RepID=UPI003D8E0F05
MVVFVGLWQLATLRSDPTLFPPPMTVVGAAADLVSDGTLGSAILVSLQRVFLGWIAGSVVAIPLGILAGTSRVARAIVDPFIHFFRFVPALALVSVFILWFGIGEASKVNLVAYSAAFIVMVNTASGAASVHADKLNAARSMGAGRLDLLRSVVVPAAVPHIFTGMRLALANAFLVIVAAEALATQNGIGFLIWNARTYFRTDQIFVGILCFGILGFIADRLWKLIGSAFLRRFLFSAGGY